MNFRYRCTNPSKKVVHLSDAEAPMRNQLAVTCRYNGQYDLEVTDYGCTECLGRADPGNGRLLCDSTRFESGSNCFLQCDQGYIPQAKTSMTCVYDADKADFDWNLRPDDFSCVKPVALLIGGQDESLRYLSEVEMLAPDLTCGDKIASQLPEPLMGAMGAFVNGLTILCGGATEGYLHCHPVAGEGNFQCDRNVDCVKTTGGTQWCTGPKSNRCYTYEPLLTQVNTF